jgi:hypothetical protein
MGVVVAARQPASQQQQQQQQQQQATNHDMASHLALSSYRQLFASWTATAHVNCASHFDEGQTTAIRVFTLLSASLSVLGALFIIASYSLFPRLRTFPFKLIVFLSVADLFAASSYIIGLAGDKQGMVCSTAFNCFFTACLSQYFDVATFIWTSIVAYNIYLVMVKNMGREVESYENLYHALSWGTSFVLMVVVAFSGGYGDAGLWCWIMPTHPLVQFFCYYLILILAFAFQATILFSVVLHVRSDPSSAASASKVTFRLLSYLMVFFLVRCWSVFDRINDAASGGQPVFALSVLHSFFSPLQGFCNAIVYGLITASVSDEWRNLLKKRCCRSAAEHDILYNDTLEDEFGSEMNTIR